MQELYYKYQYANPSALSPSAQLDENGYDISNCPRLHYLEDNQLTEIYWLNRSEAIVVQNSNGVEYRVTSVSIAESLEMAKKAISLIYSLESFAIIPPQQNNFIYANNVDNYQQLRTKDWLYDRGIYQPPVASYTSVFNEEKISFILSQNHCLITYRWHGGDESIERVSWQDAAQKLTNYILSTKSPDVSTATHKVFEFSA